MAKYSNLRPMSSHEQNWERLMGFLNLKEKEVREMEKAINFEDVIVGFEEITKNHVESIKSLKRLCEVGLIRYEKIEERIEQLEDLYCELLGSMMLSKEIPKQFKHKLQEVAERERLDLE